MAADKGKQFEYAVMLAAYGRISSNLTGEVKSTFDTIMKNTNNGSTIDDEVMKAARQTMDRIQPVSNQQEFYKSFRQLGGGAGGGGEPKTDILYVLNGKKYRVSMKWGDKYQLSSAGISKTVKVLTDVLKGAAKEGGMKTNNLGEIALVLEQIDNQLGSLPKKGEQTFMKNKLAKANHLNLQLQEILGSRKNPKAAEAFSFFKDAVVKESLTGEYLFGKNADATAEYVLNEKELKIINNNLIREISDKTYVRLRLKGRGKTKEGVRLNELVVTIEPK
tara:strand:+ start:16 stop:846 length:831 start_codon:yes stop_codon:yes gene_type:complete